MGPYINTHGNIIANDWIGLTSGVLLNPILYDESGIIPGPPGFPPVVWTGTDPLGNPVVGQTCVGWTANGTGIQGLFIATTPAWTYNPPAIQCSEPAHLYCFEQ